MFAPGQILNVIQNAQNSWQDPDISRIESKNICAQSVANSAAEHVGACSARSCGTETLFKGWLKSFGKHVKRPSQSMILIVALA